MDVFHGIEEAFDSLRDSGRLAAAVGEWSGSGSLGDARSLDDVIARCRGPVPGSRQEKDRIHVGLCLRAFREPRDETAGAFLCWLFLPGLGQLIRAFSVGSSPDDQEDIAAELLTGFCEAAARVTPTSRYVARYLLLGARRRAKRALRSAARAASMEELDSDVDLADESMVEDFADDRLARALGEGLLTRRQLDLVHATRATIGEVAALYELSLGAAQQARHRARQRLAEYLKDS